MNELFKVLFLTSAVALTAACSNSDNGDKDDRCQPDDQDGIVGGTNTVLLNVSDTAFAVGGVKSGSTQPNITVENSSTVKLTVTNVGKKLIASRLPAFLLVFPQAANKTSCFPNEANLAAIAPGDSVSVTFSTPAVEGNYQFTSSEPGDSVIVGEFVLN